MTDPLWEQLGRMFGVTWKESQTNAYTRWQEQDLQRMLVLFPTGEGKSITGLALLAARGHRRATVVAPPKTQPKWIADAKKIGMQIEVVSPTKFRMQDFKVSKHHPLIIDEFHLLGGRDAIGWKKLKRGASVHVAEILMLSATPEYNSPERAFCVDAIATGQGNFENWFTEHCITEPNRFKYYPDITGFKQFKNSLEYLIAQSYTAYVRDDAEWNASEVTIPSHVNTELEMYGLSRRHGRLVASDMEKRHKRAEEQYIRPNGLIHDDIIDVVTKIIEGEDKWLLFCAHKTVANSLYDTLYKYYEGRLHIINGDTKSDWVPKILEQFREPGPAILVGTTALATGVDGIDKVCQRLLILEDIVGDNALRRQLIGRILPRGLDDGLPRYVVTARVRDKGAV